MCGRLNVTDDPAVVRLMAELGIPLWPQDIPPKRFVRATDQVPIIFQKATERYCQPATWWLLLEKGNTGFKPSKYTSFNTRYDKLNVPRSAGYVSYRETRCIIPAKGFGETEFFNKKPIHYHDIEAQSGQAIAFGGLYREWCHPITGEFKMSCSIITLPPHEKLAHIHSKSMPLIMPQHGSTIDAWLDPTYNNVASFDCLLAPHIPQNLFAYPIDKPSTYHALAEKQLIVADTT